MGASDSGPARPLAVGETTDVFLTYAHEDHDFVVKLNQALRARGRTAWVDLEGIPPSAEWMAEIEDGIVHAQAYVFVASPQSAKSDVCAEEAAIAARHNKKTIPLSAEEVDPKLLPRTVAARQWIDAQPDKDFATVVDTLVATIDTDLDWLRMHTRLLHEALRWQADSERTSLLEGGELEDAEAWLSAAEGHEAQPTQEQVAFIAASRWGAALARAERHYERSFELSGAGRRQAAAAHLLRAVELAPAGGAPEGFAAAPGRPDWAQDAWTAYRYLDAQRGRLRGRLRAAGPVSCVAIDADATVAVVGCMTGSVELWDLAGCERIRTLSGILEAVTAVAASPGREVVAAGAEGSLLAWAADGAPPRSLLRSPGNPVTAIAFAPDGRQAFGLRDGQLVLRDAAGVELRRARVHMGSITGLAFDAEGRLLTASGRPSAGEWLGEGTASAWDPADESQRALLVGTVEGAPIAVATSPDGSATLRSLAGGAVELFPGPQQERRQLAHPQTVRAVAFGAGAHTAITGCDDGGVRIWDVAEGVEPAVFDGHLGPITCLVAGDDGATLLSGSLDASVAVWDLDRPPARTVIAEEASAIAVSAAQHVAVGTGDGAIRLLDRGGRPLADLGRPGPVVSVAMSPDGATIVVGHEDGGIAVWDVASQRRTATLAGHDATVWDLAYGPDAALVASASADGTVRLWETSSWTPRAVLTGHDGTVFGVAFTPDAGRLVSCGEDGSARLWATADGGELGVALETQSALASVAVTPDGMSAAASDSDGAVHVFGLDGRQAPRTIKAHDEAARRVAISPEGRLLLTASFDATAKCWELATGREVRSFTRHTESVYDVAFGPGERAYSAGMDGALWLWDIASGDPIGSYDLAPRRLTSMALSADAMTLAIGSLEGEVYAWDTARGRPPQSFVVGHGDGVDGLAFNHDGSFLASASRDRTVRLWSVEGGQQVVAQALDARATSVAWHPSGLRLVCGTGDKRELTESAQAFGAAGGRVALSGGADGGAVVWDFHGGPPRFLERHEGPVQDIAIAGDGRIVTAGDDASVRVWDPHSSRQLRLLEGHRDRVWGIAVSPDGSLAASGSIDNDVRLWDLESGETTRVIEQHTAGVGSVAFDARASRLVTASADGTVRVFDVATGDELRVLSGHDGGVVAVAVDPGARRALSGTLEGELLLWDLTGSDPPTALASHADSIWGIAIAPDAGTAVTSSEDGSARVWDLDTGAIRHTLSAHDVPLRKAAISPDGTEVAIGAADYAVRRFDLHSGELLGILTGHWSEATCVAYDADGATIACGAQDGTVRRWARGEEDPLDWLAGLPGGVLAADYDPSGGWLVVGGADGSLRLWDADRGELAALLPGHTAPVTGVRVHPDARRAVSCSMDGSVRVWDLAEGRELHAFADNQGPVSDVAFQDDGEVVVSASMDGSVRVRSTRTGRLLHSLAGEKRPQLDLPLGSSEGATIQLSLGGAGSPALAGGPDAGSVLLGTSQDVAELRLVRPDTASDAPRVDAALADPYAGFEGLYRSVGLRIARDGPDAGELTLA